MIWNRKEIFIGNSLQRFNEIIHILYLDKIVDSISSSSLGAISNLV